MTTSESRIHAALELEYQAAHERLLANSKYMEHLAKGEAGSIWHANMAELMLQVETPWPKY